jgi:hypothetical protein
MLFFSKAGIEAETMFNQNIHSNYYQDGIFGRGFYFYKSAQAAIKNL